MSRGIPAWASIGVALLLKIAVPAVLFVLLYRPAAGEYRSLCGEYEALDGKLKEKQDLVHRSFTGLEDRTHQAQDLLRKYDLLLAPAGKQDEVAVLVSGAVEKSGVTVEDRKDWLRKEDPARHVVLYSRELTVSGAYAAVAAFLKEVQGIPYSLSVDSLELSPRTLAAEKGTGVAARLTITGYFKQP